MCSIRPIRQAQSNSLFSLLFFVFKTKTLTNNLKHKILKNGFPLYVISKHFFKQKKKGTLQKVLPNGAMYLGHHYILDSLFIIEA
jgi:hypothetical protein